MSVVITRTCRKDERTSRFVGTTFLPIPHTDANANLIRLERRYHRSLQLLEGASGAAFAPVRNAEIKLIKEHVMIKMRIETKAIKEAATIAGSAVSNCKATAG